MGKNIELSRGEGKAVGMNITWKKGERKNIIFPVILRLLGRILSGENGKGPDIFVDENKDLKKKCGWEEYQPYF